jgi:ABC-type uncharacterized transport system substrate-binding protein
MTNFKMLIPIPHEFFSLTMQWIDRQISETEHTWNMDRTVTGSVADIRAPNIRHSTNGSL